jgi:hypothetical protein
MFYALYRFLIVVEKFYLRNEKKIILGSFCLIEYVFLKFGVEVDVEESIVNAPPDYNSDQLFKSNLTFCVFLICSLKNQSFLKRVVDQLLKSNLTFFVVCIFNLEFEKSVFLKRVVVTYFTALVY